MVANSNIPKHWQALKVSQIGSLIRGVNYKKEESTNIPTENYLPILRGNNINGILNFDDLVYVQQKNISEEQLVRKGDIVFAMSSGSKHLVGKSAKALSDFNGGFGAFCGVFRANETVNKDFIAYFFQSPYYKKVISEISKGTNINNLKREHILDLDFPSPPIPEQLAIVFKIEELFSELDNGKQQLLTAQQQLKVYRQSLLKAAFEGKLTAAWRKAQKQKGNEKLAMAAEPEILYHKSGELPEGWKWVKLGYVASKITDGEHITPRRTSNGYYLLSARNIQNGYLVLDNVDFIPEDEYNRIIKRCNPEAGDILISCSGSIGRVCRVPKNFKFTMVRSVALVKFDWNKSSSKFYEYLFQSPLLQRQIEKSKKATAQANLFLGPIKNLDIIVCPLEEQQHIVSELESKLTVCDKIEETIAQSLQQAETLRQSILKRAFEGRLV